MKWMSLAALALAITSTGCLSLKGITAITVDQNEPGIVYIAKDGEAQRCTKADGGQTFSNCKKIDIR